ncbi:Hfq-like protein [Pyrococcus kukulkanii]|uniref:Hfq-like protein n=1 Tax=Pyrococcus kukulkanii TaxID=1609559 RepID=UPI0035690D49
MAMGGADKNSEFTLDNIIGIIKVLSGEVIIGRIKCLDENFILVKTKDGKHFIVNKKAISYIEIEQ